MLLNRCDSAKTRFYKIVFDKKYLKNNIEITSNFIKLMQFSPNSEFVLECTGL